MTESLCKNCNKPKLAGRAGSITSYFFQHNYCRCDITKSSAGRSAKKEVGTDFNTCASCGKVKSENKRAGSFSAFLFQELRCTCGGKVAVRGKGQSLKKSTNRQTADRKKFTAGLRKTNFSQQESMPRVLPTGTIVAGVFRIMSVIGQGGMGAVYLAQHSGLQRSFALKVLLPNLVNEQNWQRFKAEARTVAALNHPTIVKVYDLGIHENTLPFYSMDYVTGITLEDFLIEDGALDVEQAVRVFSQVLDGLAYAHRNGIVHRDIKPANIMFATSMNFDGVKILDFGIAKLLDTDSDKQGLTMAGEVFGSPYYMSPEQSIGGQVDARSDLYSIGCALFEALTLSVPFDADGAFDILTKHQSDTPPRLNDFSDDSEFSDSLECVIAKCLAKLPEERYQNAKELVLDLDRIKAGKDLSEYPHLARQFADLTGRDASSRFLYDDHDDQNEDEPRVGKKFFDQSATRLALIFLLTVIPIALIAGFMVMNSIQAERNYAQARLSAVKTLDDHFNVPGSSSIAETNSEGAILPKIEAERAQEIEAFLKSRKTPYAAHPANAVAGKKYFDFPSKFSIGEMQISKPGSVLNTVAAQGRMILPASSRIIFSANQNTAQYPELFKFFQADDLSGLMLFKNINKNIPLTSLQNLTGLESLDLTKHESTNDDIPALDKFRHLLSLKLGLCEIRGEQLSRCLILPQLTSLTLNRIDDCIPVFKALQKSKKLNYLALSGKLRPDEIKSLSQLSFLRILVLINLELTEADCKLLSSLENLCYLEISGVTVDAKKLKALSHLSNLNYLSFDKIDCAPAVILEQLKSFKKLRQVSLPNSVGISKAVFEKAFPDIIFSRSLREDNSLIQLK